MTKTHYIVKNEKTFNWKNKDQIGKGCTLIGEEFICEKYYDFKEYTDREQAMEDFKKCESFIRKYDYNGIKFDVTEYYLVLDVNFDEDGELSDDNSFDMDISEFSTDELEKLEDDYNI